MHEHCVNCGAADVKYIVTNHHNHFSGVFVRERESTAYPKYDEDQREPEIGACSERCAGESAVSMLIQREWSVAEGLRPSPVLQGKGVPAVIWRPVNKTPESASAAE